MNDYEVIVEVPASTANLGAGFDTIGMALQLYTKIKMKRSIETNVTYTGHHQQGLPKDKSNLIYQAADMLCKQANISTPELAIAVESDIPLARGLGSSGAAIIGGLVGANALIGEPLTREEIFQLAARMEGHPDNVGASIFGGIIIAAKDAYNHYTYLNFPPPEPLRVIVSIPNYELPTKKARGVLPNHYSREDTVHALSHSALLAAALAKGDLLALEKALDDRIHQPYRKHLLPGFEEILKNGTKNGAIGVAISGAGPAIIAFTSNESEQLITYIEHVMEKHHILTKTVEIPIDCHGVVCNIHQGTP